MSKHEASDKDAASITLNTYQHEPGIESKLGTKMGLRGAIALAYTSMSTWIAFSSCIAVALSSGGANVLVWGLIIVVLCNLAGASTIAEPASIWPNSAGQAAWSFRLANTPTPRIRLATGIAYAQSFLTCMGLLFLGLAAQSITAQILLAMAVLGNPTFVIQPWMVTLLIIAAALFATAFGTFGARLIEKANIASLLWSITGLVVISLTLLITSRGEYNSAEVAFTQIVNESGWPTTFVPWSLGLAQAALSTTAFDIVAHFAEETERPHRDAPVAMVAGLGLSGFVTLLYALVLVFVLPSDVTALASTSTGFPFAQLLLDKTGSPAGAIVLMLIILIPFLLTISDVNMAASRSLLSLAREGGIPGQSWMAHIHPRFDAPVRAQFVVLAIQAPLSAIYAGNTTAFFAIISVPTIALAITYATVAAQMLLKRKHLSPPFSLGSVLGPVCNVITIAFTLFLTVILSLPATYPPTPQDMNYTSVILVAILLTAAVFWVCYGRRHYRGPDGVMDK